MTKLKWKNVGKKQWESISIDKEYDFVIDGRTGIVLIIFNNKIKDHNKAYIDSIQVNSIEEAKKEAENY